MNDPLHPSNWFPNLEPSLQRSLRADPSRPLEPEEANAILNAGGTATMVQWDDSPSFSTLLEPAVQWIQSLPAPTTEFGSWDAEGSWSPISED